MWEQWAVPNTHAWGDILHRHALGRYSPQTSLGKIFSRYIPWEDILLIHLSGRYSPETSLGKIFSPDFLGEIFFPDIPWGDILVLIQTSLGEIFWFQFRHTLGRCLVYDAKV